MDERQKRKKLSAGQIAEISRKLLVLKAFIPKSFARKPRRLEEIDRWKATELRQFLLYSGKLVLRGTLRQELYDHFMTFSIAMCILACPRIAQMHSEYAHNLLKYFVGQAHILYGKEFLVYNVHCLLHIASDVEQFGSLDNFSAFRFENYLHKIKKLVGYVQENRQWCR